MPAARRATRPGLGASPVDRGVGPSAGAPLAAVATAWAEAAGAPRAVRRRREPSPPCFFSYGSFALTSSRNTQTARGRSPAADVMPHAAAPRCLSRKTHPHTSPPDPVISAAPWRSAGHRRRCRRCSASESHRPVTAPSSHHCAHLLLSRRDRGAPGRRLRQTRARRLSPPPRLPQESATSSCSVSRLVARVLGASSSGIGRCPRRPRAAPARR